MRKLNYWEMKRKIIKLQELSRLNANPEEYIPLIKLMFNCVPIKAIPLENEFIYRSRLNVEGKLFDTLDDLKYPPKDNVKVKGRLNDIGESILYAALCELGTIIESRPKMNRLFTISTIKHVAKKALFIPIGITGREFSASPDSKAGKLLIDYCYSEITKNVFNPIEYNSTIAIAHFMLKKNILNYIHEKITGLIYPSVESKKVSSVTTYNVAITPEVFDLYFTIVNVSVYCLTIEPSHYQLNEVNKVSAIDSSGRIKWLYDFNEMKDRISRGLCADGSICNNLILSTA